MKIKVLDLFNSKNDVRRFIKPMIDDVDIEFLSDDFSIDSSDVETILSYVQLTVKGETIDDEIELEEVKDDE